MSDPDWQSTEKQAKEAGQVILDTKAEIRGALADGLIGFLKACGVKVDDEATRAKAQQFLEDIGAP